MSKKLIRSSLLALALLSVLLCFSGCDTSYGSTDESEHTLTSFISTEDTKDETDISSEVPTEAHTEAPTVIPTEAPTEAQTESIHTHNWVNATCTTPKTCSDCGQTEGEAGGHAWRDSTCTEPKRCMECDITDGSAKGHSFEDATCTSAKKCSDCGITEGSALGHSYSGGKCTRCGAADPEYTAETMVWIPTKGGKKYHKSSGCSNMEDPIQVTKSEAISQGFDACKKCY